MNYEKIWEAAEKLGLEFSGDPEADWKVADEASAVERDEVRLVAIERLMRMITIYVEGPDR